MDVSNVSNAGKTYGIEKPGSTEAAKKSSQVGGRTVGEPKLSETGKKYYDELRKKYGDMDFVLVSKDMKDSAMKNAGAYANPTKTVVLIDEEKIEKMATDDAYRKQYEGILDNAKAQIPELKKALENTPGLKGFGMQVNDNGTTSFFAIMEKGNAAQAERISKRNAEKKAEKKAADKKADKKKAEEKLEERRAAAKADKAEKSGKSEKSDKSGKSRTEKYNPDDYDFVEAGSIDELISRLSDYSLAKRSDSVMTPAETMLGSHVDYSM